MSRLRFLIHSLVIHTAQHFITMQCKITLLKSWKVFLFSASLVNAQNYLMSWCLCKTKKKEKNFTEILIECKADCALGLSLTAICLKGDLCNALYSNEFLIKQKECNHWVYFINLPLMKGTGTHNMRQRATVPKNPLSVGIVPFKKYAKCWQAMDQTISMQPFQPTFSSCRFLVRYCDLTMHV